MGVFKGFDVSDLDTTFVKEMEPTPPLRELKGTDSEWFDFIKFIRDEIEKFQLGVSTFGSYALQIKMESCPSANVLNLFEKQRNTRVLVKLLALVELDFGKELAGAALALVQKIDPGFKMDRELIKNV